VTDTLTQHGIDPAAVMIVAAGALIVQEAGGAVTDMDGRPYSLATERPKS
jgi:fructose-1,6-bisphosphatase/inositol monophosphatase family enzyme